ncbi:MAG: aspartate kinase [Oligoflexia bacterium]|nr:aspartate kinase [Oligoflexia bacterium]
MSKTIAKFGGSSVKDAQAFLNCFHILEKYPEISFVILSATYNTTNQLEELYQSVLVNKKVEELKDNLITKHEKIISELGLRSEISEGIINKLNDYIVSAIGTESFSPELMDKFYSIGELWSTTIFAELLKTKGRKVEFVESFKFIKTDSMFTMANICFDESVKAISEFKKQISEDILYVAQGFIGSDLKSRITTLGREGSDYSATIFANLLGFEEVQIWTDVAGIANSDPRHIEGTSFFEQLSYDQAETMASHGAKVLFSRTLRPIKDKKIPLWVKSTKAPELKGTKVCSEAFDEKDFLALTFQKRGNSFMIYLLGQNLNHYHDQLIGFDPIDFQETKVTFMLEESNSDLVQNIFETCLKLDKSSRKQDHQLPS